MTSTVTSQSATTTGRHALDPLSPEEIAVTSKTLRTERELTASVRFVSISLLEPAKSELVRGAGTAEPLVIDDHEGLVIFGVGLYW